MYVCLYVCPWTPPRLLGGLSSFFVWKMRLIIRFYINYISLKSIDNFLCNCSIFIIFWFKIQIVLRKTTSAGGWVESILYYRRRYKFYFCLLANSSETLVPRKLTNIQNMCTEFRYVLNYIKSSYLLGFLND